MTNVAPPDPSAWRKAAWGAASALAAQSNILGPYILILTAMVGVELHLPDGMTWGLYSAGLLAWKNSQ